VIVLSERLDRPMSRLVANAQGKILYLMYIVIKGTLKKKIEYTDNLKRLVSF
jgi:hypothetical protein